MPTTGTVLAKNMKLYIGSTAITCQVDASLSMTTNMFETTCKDSSGTSAFLPGSTSWTVSGSGNFAFDSMLGFSGATGLFDYWKDQGVAALVFQTSVTGDLKYSGNAYISSLTLNSSGNDEAVTFDFEFQGTGALAEATVA